MKNRIDKRIRQYNICKVIEYVGCLVVTLSFFFLLSVAGTSDMCEEMGIAGPSIGMMLFKVILSFIGTYLGYKITVKGKKWADINRKKLMNMNSDIRRF